MTNKRKKKPVCSKTECNDQSLDFFTCATCKLPCHLNCSNLDSEMLAILQGNTSEGYTRCDECVEKGSPDPTSLRDLLLELSKSISEKVDEFKTILGMSSLLDIGTAIQQKVEQLKTSAEKSGLVSQSTPTPDISKSVEIQTDDVKEDRTHSSDNRNICQHYKRGKCRHGASGKYLVDGTECPFSHPRKCLTYCRYGKDSIKGCVGPCELMHPFLCKNSINYKECMAPNCTFAYLMDTKRPNTTSQGNYRVNTHQQQTQHKNQQDYYISPRISTSRNRSYGNRHDVHRNNMTCQLNERLEFEYDRNDFPPLTR